MTDAPVVLQVLPALGIGGVERGTVEMAEAIAASGGFALVASAGGRLVGAVERVGGRNFIVPLDTKNPFRIWRNAARLAKIIRAERVTIVHARSRAPAWSAWIACQRTGAHFVTTYHGAYQENFPLKRRYNSVMAKGERVIAISRFIAARIVAQHGLDPARIRVIPRGVDIRVFDPDAVAGDRMAALARAWRLPDGVPVVMLPGRLAGWKGQSVLIDALARMPDLNICCVLVGSGGERITRRLLKQAERLGVGQKLRLVGATDDMPAALMLADVVIHASITPEAFGRVVIEAQAMGRPVIASDIGGPVETVEHGVTGWRVPPGDPAALAETLRDVLAMPLAQRQALAGVTRANVARFYTKRAMQEATLDVYEAVLTAARVAATSTGHRQGRFLSETRLCLPSPCPTAPCASSTAP